MNLFQILALVVVGLALLRDVSLARRGQLRSAALILRVGVMLAAAAAIAKPQVTQRVAELLGIGRGADVVLYLSALALIFVSLYFYGRITQQQRRLTELVRHLALVDARRGGAESGDEARRPIAR